MKLRASLVALAACASVASAAGITLYEDVKTKQIFTEPGENRQKMGSFVQENNLAEMMSKEVKSIPVTAKAKKIEFSGTHYLGYTYASPRVKDSKTDNSAGFEMRRNYVQVKGYLNDKDYLRVTLDATKELASEPGADLKTKGYAEVFVKYAYLWLDNVLPYTGTEIGIAHRPWIDYEEHNSWYYRSINKVSLEHKKTDTEAGPDLINSADFGVNFKTKTDFFTSEIGVFNGEGYHADKKAANQKNSTDMSLEWRLTAHPFADGKKVGKYDRTKEQFLQISTYGITSNNHKDNDKTVDDPGEYSRNFYGIHAVYNHPMALIAGQYFMAKDDYKNSGATKDKKEVNGYSINAEIRPVKDWTIIGRYDAHITDDTSIAGVETRSQDVKQTIYGIAYKASKNVTYIASGKNIKDKKNADIDKNVYMMTAEVKW